MSYEDHGIAKLNQLITSKNGTWDGISAEAVTRMRLQNRFHTGLDIARYTKRNIVMRDGSVVSDTPVTERFFATEELRRLSQAHQAVNLAP